MSAAATPPYVELHCHSAYSFLDGVSLPDELARRAGELGYEALALTDHNSLSGSMELAQVAADCGVRAIHGAEVDVTLQGVGAREGADTGHLTLLVRDQGGWRNLCRIITLAHAHTREGSGPARAGRGARGARERAGARGGPRLPDRLRGALPAGARGHGRGARGCGRAMARARAMSSWRGACATRSVAQNLYVELQRPFARHDRARNRALTALARAGGGALRGDGQRACAHARAGGAAGRVRGAAQPRDAGGVRAAAPRQPQPRDEHAAGDGESLPGAP